MAVSKILATCFLVGTLALVSVVAANAATQVVTATVKFLTDLSITQNSAPNFGYVKAGACQAFCVNGHTFSNFASLVDWTDLSGG